MRFILYAALLAVSAPSVTMSPNVVFHPPTAPRLTISSTLFQGADWAYFVPFPVTVLQGSNWAYFVPFPVKNKEIIEKLISCESQGINEGRPDPNGSINWGILQFNGSSTWQEMEARFNLHGSPMIPADAIRMADAMISGGFVGRWTCAHLLDLVNQIEPEAPHSGD
jgi:hypothetical protein